MARAVLCPSCGGALDPDERACPHCGATCAARRCGVCFDLNLAGDTNCRHCGSRLPAEDAAARPERLPCPGCGATMTPRRLDHAAFDECDACGGMWLSPDTAADMATHAESRALMLPFDAPPAAGGPPPTDDGRDGRASRVAYRPCPVCGKMMNRAQYAVGAGVVLDLCRHHGSYYDRGELTRIFAFIESGGLEKARRREQEALKEDVRNLRRKAIAAGVESSQGLPGPAEPWERFGALDLIRWIAGYLGGNRPANSG